MSLLYLGNISLNITKENSKIEKKIIKINEQININEVEYNLYTNYEYIKKLHGIYFNNNKSLLFSNNRINFEDFKKTNISNVQTVGIK